MKLKRMQLLQQPAVPELQGMLVVGAQRRAGLPTVTAIEPFDRGITVTLETGAVWLVAHGCYGEFDLSSEPTQESQRGRPGKATR